MYKRFIDFDSLLAFLDYSRTDPYISHVKAVVQIIVKLLIDMKADTMAKNDMDEIPLHIAAWQVAGGWGQDQRFSNALHIAAYYNQTKMISYPFCVTGKVTDVVESTDCYHRIYTSCCFPPCYSDKSQTLLYDKDKN